MKIIRPDAEQITEQDPLRKIEYCGRTCYKSNSDFTDESAMKFYRNLVTRKHTAMQEHAALVFEVCKLVYDTAEYTYLHKTKTETADGMTRYLVSGNFRAINECGNNALIAAAHHENPAYVLQALQTGVNEDDLKRSYNPLMARVVSLRDIKDLQTDEKCAHTYVSYKLTCDRGVTHELVRHRVFSFAQESSRYCNYGQNKFGNQITVINPPFWEFGSAQYDLWCELQQLSEAAYMQILEAGGTPEEARSVLTNSLKAEIIMTGNLNAWDHFFQLRYFGSTGKPHPQMLELATLIYDRFPFKEAIL